MNEVRQGMGDGPYWHLEMPVSQTVRLVIDSCISLTLPDPPAFFIAFTFGYPHYQPYLAFSVLSWRRLAGLSYIVLA